MQIFKNLFDTLYKHMTVKLNKTNQNQYKKNTCAVCLTFFDFFPWCPIQELVIC